MSHSASTIFLFFIRLQIVSFLIHSTWNVALILSLLSSVRVHVSSFVIDSGNTSEVAGGESKEKLYYHSGGYVRKFDHKIKFVKRVKNWRNLLENLNVYNEFFYQNIGTVSENTNFILTAF